MKRLIPLLAAILLLASCGTPSQSLYSWDNYLSAAYKAYKTDTEEDICNLVCTLENMTSHPGGTRQVPPPGICAEYGYLLLQPRTIEAFSAKATPAQKKIFGDVDFGAVFTEKGKDMLLLEIEYYPESAKFIKPLLSKLVR